MEKRKVTGQRGKAKRVDGTEYIREPSYRLTLPKWWCRKHGVGAGSYLDVSEESDGSLRIALGTGIAERVNPYP